MNLGIQQLKVLKKASQETLCFECIVTVDGVDAFVATNSGQGGGNSYHAVRGGSYQTIRDAEAYAASLPPAHYDEMEIAMDLDILIGDLIGSEMVAKDYRRDIRRNVVYQHEGQIWMSQVTPPHTHIALIAAVKKKYPDSIVLNELTEAEAVKILSSTK